jgi:hypothetical protein
MFSPSYFPSAYFAPVYFVPGGTPTILPQVIYGTARWMGSIYQAASRQFRYNARKTGP